MKKNKLFILLGVLILASIFYKIKLNNNRISEELKSAYIIVIGSFVEFYRHDYAVNTRTIIKYNLKDREYFYKLNFDAPCKTSYTKNVDIVEKLKNINIPIAVSLRNKSNCLPLLRPEDFKSIGMLFPDSLKTNYNKYFNCSFYSKYFYDD